MGAWKTIGIKNMDLKVTIGVCVKNSERTIKESVSSIVNQKYPAELMQVIIVDGCSKDRTMAIIDETTEKAHLKAETYSDKGQGLGAARQIVVNKASGKYIIFADADVELFEDFVKNHVDFMEENSNVGVAFGRPMYREGTTVSVSTIENLVSYATGGFLGNDATIYRAEVIKKVGGFDPNIKGASEDRDLINRIRMKGWLTSVNSKARFFHETRTNLRDFSAEQSWFGYGDHYISNKKKNRYVRPIWHQLPIGSFKSGLEMAIKAYRLTHRKLSFLIPLLSVFGNISWWSGYMKAHLNGYGHEKTGTKIQNQNCIFDDKE